MLTIFADTSTQEVDGNPSKKSIVEEPNNFEQLQNERYSSDTIDRKWLARWQATVVTTWLLAVFGILICNHATLHLSDTVLSVLLGTTTLNVLGLSFIVLRGHFQSPVVLDNDKD